MMTKQREQALWIDWDIFDYFIFFILFSTVVYWVGLSFGCFFSCTVLDFWFTPMKQIDINTVAYYLAAVCA